MGGASGGPRLLGIYSISNTHTKIIQIINKSYIKTCEKDIKIYKDIENSQGTLLLQKCRPLYICKKKKTIPEKIDYFFSANLNF